MNKPVNSVIKTLVLTNFLMYSAWGFLTPIFAIFIVQKIDVSGTAQAAEVAGFAFFVYWVMKSLFQVPFSKFVDARKGEKDDFWFMVVGLLIVSVTPIGFLFSSLPWHLYALNVVHAVGMALFVPSWNAVFTRHIDRGKEAFEWALDSTCLGLGYGITGAAGGLLAAIFGFEVLFITAAIISFSSAGAILLVHKKILPKDQIFSWLPKPRAF